MSVSRTRTGIGSVYAAAQIKSCLHDFTEQRGKSAKHVAREAPPARLGERLTFSSYHLSLFFH